MSQAAISDDPFLTANQVRQRYGRITDTTLTRWRNDPRLKFPEPEPIRSRLYWRKSVLDAWDLWRKAQAQPA